jgi:hypothetical protein
VVKGKNINRETSPEPDYIKGRKTKPCYKKTT